MSKSTYLYEFLNYHLAALSASFYEYYNKATAAGAFVQPTHFKKAKQTEIKLKLYTIHKKITQLNILFFCERTILASLSHIFSAICAVVPFGIDIF